MVLNPYKTVTFWASNLIVCLLVADCVPVKVFYILN